MSVGAIVGFILILGAIGVLITVFGNGAKVQRDLMQEVEYAKMFWDAFPTKTPTSYYDVYPFLNVVDYMIFLFIVGDMTDETFQATVAKVLKKIKDYKGWWKYDIDITDYQYINAVEVAPYDEEDK